MRGPDLPDPPFNSNKTYAAPIGSEAAGAAFKDTWTLSDVDEAWHGEIADREPALYAIIDAARQSHGNGMKSYLIMMAVRLLEMHRVLKDTGSIYLHCDPTASHYLKMLMDTIWGTEHFRNEIIWAYRGGGSPKKDFGRRHDVILRYSRTDQYQFLPDAVRIPYQAEGIGRTDDAMWGKHKGSNAVYKPHLLEPMFKVNSSGSEPLEHEMNHSYMNPSLRAFGQFFVVFAEPPVSAQPPKGALHDPPTGQLKWTPSSGQR